MTIIKGDTGYIVIDPMTTTETVNATWNGLVVPNLGDLPVKAVIYTHSHSDHIGGTRALLTDAQVASGQAKIVAPDNFIHAAVGENVIAGNAMSRRTTYHVGSTLDKSATGQVDGGLGKGLPAGTGTRELSKRHSCALQFCMLTSPSHASHRLHHQDWPKDGFGRC